MCPPYLPASQSCGDQSKHITKMPPLTGGFCFLESQAGIDILFHINRSAVNKPQLFQEILHDNIVAMGIDPQMTALFECPVDTESTDSLF